ncbi:MAG: type II toxin-antitoxin system VapC family toxin [Candidatus Binatia bacterium]
MRYFDASALVKRYVEEDRSARVRELLKGDDRATSRFTEAEIASALARRNREGLLDGAGRDRALDAMRKDRKAIHIVELSPEVVDLCIELIGRRALRSGDGVQLASCLHLRRSLEAEVHLVAYDDRLATAARAEGLTVLT